MQLEIRHFRVLDTVARTGSLTAAAAQLGTSQPALSAQLGRIEQALGSPVFARGRAGSRLTPFGEIVIERMRAVIADVDELLAEAAVHAGGAHDIRVASNRSPFLASMLCELERILGGRAIVPTVEFSSSVITDNLAAGEVDLAFVGVHIGINDEAPPGVHEAVFVDREPFLVAIAEDHRLGGDVLDFAQLATEPWLLPPGRPDGTYLALHRTCVSRGVEIHAPYGRQSLADYWPTVAAGRAIALALPTFDPPPGTRLAAIAGNPLVGRRVLRWRPDRLDHDEAMHCARAAARIYEADVLRASARHRWWSAVPASHPRLADLGPPTTGCGPDTMPPGFGAG